MLYSVWQIKHLLWNDDTAMSSSRRSDGWRGHVHLCKHGNDEGSSAQSPCGGCDSQKPHGPLRERLSRICSQLGRVASFISLWSARRDPLIHGPLVRSTTAFASEPFAPRTNTQSHYGTTLSGDLIGAPPGCEWGWALITCNLRVACSPLFWILKGWVMERQRCHHPGDPLMHSNVT